MTATLPVPGEIEDILVHHLLNQLNKGFYLVQPSFYQKPQDVEFLLLFDEFSNSLVETKFRLNCYHFDR